MKNIIIILILFVFTSCSPDISRYKLEVIYDNGDKSIEQIDRLTLSPPRLHKGCIYGRRNEICGVRKFIIISTQPLKK